VHAVRVCEDQGAKANTHYACHFALTRLKQ
jgi:hypothetical protein